MENRDGKLVLRFNAYRHLRPDELDEDSWTGWTQKIEITCGRRSCRIRIHSLSRTDLRRESDSGSNSCEPGGHCRHRDSSITLIDFDLKSRSFGQGDDGEEYKDMVVRGATAAITFKGEPQFVEKWRRAKPIEPTHRESKAPGNSILACPVSPRTRNTWKDLGSKKTAAGPSTAR